MDTNGGMGTYPCNLPEHRFGVPEKVREEIVRLRAELADSTAQAKKAEAELEEAVNILRVYADWGHDMAIGFLARHDREQVSHRALDEALSAVTRQRDAYRAALEATDAILQDPRGQNVAWLPSILTHAQARIHQALAPGPPQCKRADWLTAREWTCAAFGCGIGIVVIAWGYILIALL